MKRLFQAVKGWTTRYEINGDSVGGSLDLSHDPRMEWWLSVIGGAVNKRALELGPLECAHTKMLIEAGAKEIIAVEGNANCFIRCLIVKEAFRLNAAKLVFGDLCDYVAYYQAAKFDFVLASGVLYHQHNPAQVIYDLSPVTDRVLVWSQVASATMPSATEGSCQYSGRTYSGKINNYGGALETSTYCGGPHKDALWLYPDDMRRCFNDAGFLNIIETPAPSNPYGDVLQFAAMK